MKIERIKERKIERTRIGELAEKEKKTEREREKRERERETDCSDCRT